MKCRKAFVILWILFSCGFSYGQEKPQLVTITGYYKGITSIVFSSNGRYVALAEDQVVKIYDQVILLLFNSFRLHSDNILELKYFYDNHYVLVVTSGYSVW